MPKQDADLAVDGFQSGWGDLLHLGEVAAKEHLARLLANRHPSDRLTHAEVGHHGTSQLGGGVEVAFGSSGDLAEHQLLDGGAAHGCRELTAQVRLRED